MARKNYVYQQVCTRCIYVGLAYLGVPEWFGVLVARRRGLFRDLVAPWRADYQ